MKAKKKTILALTIAGSFALASTLAWGADDTVPLDLPGSDGMPKAGDAQPAGTAPGGPVEQGTTEAPNPPNKDPVAPVEPPPPEQ